MIDPQKAKNLIIARSAIAKLTKEEIDEIDDSFYNAEEQLFYVDAQHEWGGENYRWYIPKDFDEKIEPGDLLLVEQVVGFGKAVVRATDRPHWMTKGSHEELIHPYCRVLKKL